ncbi:hypothetical protein D8674_000884 [Pyrus ussuriensis x Pyrus communis]|uniref:Uncharacterized protein n=1 Tax=Pyrus ussuriensis x Pyrus communis TaxID=2448454 RepID=A0A5N5FHV2_9ROSA|nr:hypothetical protein D8674_000884 [Pyrus ussuriensis x Pyrus communis]
MVSWPSGDFHSNRSSNSSLNFGPFTRENKDDLKCTLCGQTHHTKDTCFAKHEVLEWFPELKKRLQAKERANNGTNGGRASLAASKPSNTKEAEMTSSDPSQSLSTRTGESLSNTDIVGRVLLAFDHVSLICIFPSF